MPHDIVRPMIHFTPPSGWMNDPNGLVYYQGEYHLLYQHNPDSIDWGNIHWGHAVSRDFVHWEHLPEALYPDAIGTIWSGSVVVDDRNTSGLLPEGGLVALFSYSDQSQGMAYSSDKGRTWTKYAYNPVIANDGSHDFRDPKVMWDAQQQAWRMTIAANTTIRFYTSPNLIDWMLTGSFSDPNMSNDSVWECPDLLPFVTADGQTKWVLYFCLNEGGAPAGGSGTCYYVGNFDGHTFTSDDGKRLWMDAGKDNYAGTTWSNLGDGRTVFIGWMTNQSYSGQIPASTWRGTMTLPRELSLKRTVSGWRLIQQPLRELMRLRTSVVNKERIAELHPWPHYNVDTAIELITQFEMNNEEADAVECGIRIRTGEKYITVGINRSQQIVFVDRTTSGGFENSDHLQRHTAPLETLDTIRLHIFLDSGSIEVFVNDGEIVFSELLFMDMSDRRLSLYAIGGEGVGKELYLYTLSAIGQAK